MTAGVVVEGMLRVARQLRAPAVIGSLLVLPFIGLELINRRSFEEAFPFPLFGLLWLLPVTFILTLMRMVRTLRTGGTVRTHPVSILLGVAFLTLIAWIWVSILVDQVPCFLGVPHCD
jgi:hypothetical protein